MSRPEPAAAPLPHDQCPAPPGWYRRLLACYPARHRQRYGSEMELLFHDRWRETTTRTGGLPRAGFVFRTLVDFLRTCPAEHWYEWRQRPSWLTDRARFWSWVSGGAIAGLVISLTVAVTALMPRVYLSTSRLLLRDAPRTVLVGNDGRTLDDAALLQAERERLLSLESFARVAEKLNLREVFRRRFVQGQPVDEPADLLLWHRWFTEVRPGPGPRMLEVRVWDPDPHLAAQIANALTEVHLASRLRESPDGQPHAVVVDQAEPGLKPVRPNVPLNLLLGLLGAAVLGPLVGTVVRWSLRRTLRVRQADGPRTG